MSPWAARPGSTPTLVKPCVVPPLVPVPGRSCVSGLPRLPNLGRSTGGRMACRMHAFPAHLSLGDGPGDGQGLGDGRQREVAGDTADSPSGDGAARLRREVRPSRAERARRAARALRDHPRGIARQRPGRLRLRVHHDCRRRGRRPSSPSPPVDRHWDQGRLRRRPPPRLAAVGAGRHRPPGSAAHGRGRVPGGIRERPPRTDHGPPAGGRRVSCEPLGSGRAACSRAPAHPGRGDRLPSVLPGADELVHRDAGGDRGGRGPVRG